MGENIYNTKADKRYRNLGIILTLIMLCCFVLIIIAFIMGYEWVKSQKDIVTSFSQLGLNSIIISLVLYSCAIIFLGSPKYTFFPMINSIKIKLLGFLFMYYFGVFLQTLAYFIFGLPIAFLLIETTGLT
ncbi:hypothetical protein, partial [Psychrobacillus psychrotolerans]|uniref:hypothetical protein n=2 Tax=Bacillaceae TaxID=186817 RepID=UPI003C714AD5